MWILHLFKIYTEHVLDSMDYFRSYIHLSKTVFATRELLVDFATREILVDKERIFFFSGDVGKYSVNN